MPNQSPLTQSPLTAISATTQSYVDQLWRNIQTRIAQMIKAELAAQIGSGVQGGKVIATAVAGTLPTSAWSPLVNNGDLIYQHLGGPTALPIGVAGQTLQVINNAPAWGFGSSTTSLLVVPTTAIVAGSDVAYDGTMSTSGVSDFALVFTTQGDVIALS